MSKTALITGITGQDGSYLAEQLLARGYIVHGIIRRHSTFTTYRIEPIWDQLTLHHGDMLDQGGLRHLLTKIKPDEIYNLAAQSHVRVSFEQPQYTTGTISSGTMNLLEAVRDYQESTGNAVAIYQASSSEMFGDSPPMQSEDTVFHPRSPYACAKLHAHHLAQMYRDAYGLFVCCGILFNHESPRRGETFVTRKITRAVARIKLGKQRELRLGNIRSARDWGYAADYTLAMWLMLQHPSPDDYVIATGKMTTVTEWLDMAFGHVGLEWQRYVKYADPHYIRPLDVVQLCGDARKAQLRLGWKPLTSVRDLCTMMVEADLRGEDR